jgi:hypothetical protein
MASGVAGSDDVCGEPVPLGGIDSLSAMEVYEEHHDLEEVRSLLGHARLETTQLYAQIRPAALKHAVDFYEARALDVLSS